MNPLPKPTARDRIHDAVQMAGHDVKQWQFDGQGKQVKNPTSNGRFCYRWSFIETGVSVVLCIWWEDIDGDERGAFYKSNSREEAMELVRAVEDWRHSPADRQRASQWAKSARGFDAAVRAAAAAAPAPGPGDGAYLPVRVVLVARKDSAKPMGDFERSEAHYRQIDSEFWYVDRYSYETGDYLIRRGPRPVDKACPPAPPLPDDGAEPAAQACELSIEDTDAGASIPVPAVDQFVGSERPNQYLRNGIVYERLTAVREHVLRRANGQCELVSCRLPGFKTTKGAVYLETHHVVPLALGGADTPANVIALCPSHHREAHHGVRKEQIYDEAMRCISAAEIPMPSH